jgi:hypothetical protein
LPAEYAGWLDSVLPHTKLTFVKAASCDRDNDI